MWCLIEGYNEEKENEFFDNNQTGIFINKRYHKHAQTIQTITTNELKESRDLNSREMRNIPVIIDESTW